jgi:phytol kinase
MLREAPFAVMIAGGVLLALYLANVFYDYKIPQYISRKIGHLGGCVGFLLCPLLFSDFWWPFILTLGFSGLLLYARWRRPNAFRGVGGSGRPDALAEIHFPATGIILVGVLWGILGQPWLAIVPLCFMGAGDAITGLIRSRVYNREVKGAWGSLGMICVCLLLAVFIKPYWIGIIGASVATMAEKWTPASRWVDDNLTIPLVSAAVMTLLFYLGVL